MNHQTFILIVNHRALKLLFCWWQVEEDGSFCIFKLFQYKWKGKFLLFLEAVHFHCWEKIILNIRRLWYVLCVCFDLLASGSVLWWPACSCSCCRCVSDDVMVWLCCFPSAENNRIAHGKSILLYCTVLSVSQQWMCVFSSYRVCSLRSASLSSSAGHQTSQPSSCRHMRVNISLNTLQLHSLKNTLVHHLMKRWVMWCYRGCRRWWCLSGTVRCDAGPLWERE